jgi:hypothetical protein
MINFEHLDGVDPRARKAEAECLSKPFRADFGGRGGERGLGAHTFYASESFVCGHGFLGILNRVKTHGFLFRFREECGLDGPEPQPEQPDRILDSCEEDRRDSVTRRMAGSSEDPRGQAGARGLV